MWLDIEVLTPVHLGTGEVLGPMEYAVNGQKLRIADLGKLFRRDPVRAEVIGQRLAAASPAALREISLDALLTRDEMADDGIWRYRLSGSGRTLTTLASARGKEHEFRLASKTPDGRAYLPGTAIKGALRTALIFAWSAASPEWARRLLAQPNAGAANREVQRVLYGARSDPSHDLFRALAIGDTDGALPSDVLQVVQERVLSARIRADWTRGPGDDEYKTFLVFLECLKPGVRLRARVRILGGLLTVGKTQVLGWNEKQRGLSVELLCDAVNRMSREVCGCESEYFGRVQGQDCSGIASFYRDLSAELESPAERVAYLCLGRGAGWHKLTPGILMARHLSQPEFSQFREKYGLAAFGRFDRREFVFPKSRKVVAEGSQAVLPLGWVRITFREGEPAVSARVPEPSRPGNKGLSAPDSLTDAALDREKQSPVPPNTPPRDPHVVEAERLIRSLKHHEVRSMLQAVAGAIRKCAAGEEEGLVELFRKRQEELAFKPKDLRANMESLTRRLGSGKNREP